MKTLLTIFLIFVGILAILFLLTYPQFRKAMNSANERLESESTVLPTEQGDIEYAVKGNGTPVLVLHGAGGGYDQGLWIGQMCLGDKCKLISVSRYGYLNSSIPENASIKSQAALYKILLDYLDIDQVIVIGSSAGGPSAMQFANDFPHRCKALILLSAVSTRRIEGDEEASYINIMHRIQQSDYLYWVFTRFLRSRILGLMGIPADVYKSFTPEQKKLAQEMLDIMHPMSKRYNGTVNDGIMIEFESIATDAITAPALILHAKDDALVSFGHADYAEKKVRTSRLMTFETGGHGLLSRVDEVRGYIKQFLGGDI